MLFGSGCVFYRIRESTGSNDCMLRVSKRHVFLQFELLNNRFFENTFVFLHEFDRDSLKKHVFTVNCCFEAFQVIFPRPVKCLWMFHDGNTLAFHTRVWRWLLRKLCFHIDESARRANNN